MSRATVDLQSVRFFLGYGLIFIVQSALTIVLAAVAMFIIDPVLALVALIPVPFVVLVAARYGRRSRPALQEVQQRIAELTAEAEENISGVRVVKAFAREDRQRARFERAVARVFDQSMISTRLRAFYNPFIGFLPQLGLAALLFVGGRRVIDGDADARRVHRLLHVPAHAARPDAHARHVARHGPARDRVGRAAVRDPRPRAADRRAAGRAAAARRARAASSCATSRCTTRARATPALRDVSLDVAAGHDGRARRRDRLGQDDARPAPPAPLRPDARAACSSTAPTCATSTSARCAARSRSSTTTRSCSARRVHENIAYAREDATREEVVDGGAARAGARLHRARCPTATTRASASAA